MKANELRLGNYVLRNGFLQEDKETFNKIVVSHNDITACVVASESFKPIPITEEWLLKFGFDLIKSGCESPSDWYFRHNNLTGSIDNLTWKYTHQHGLKLKYVHQLQNLYFALTGEELKLV